jgi:Domain of Unknown Function with PDB structure (DUF3857)
MPRFTKREALPTLVNEAHVKRSAIFFSHALRIYVAFVFSLPPGAFCSAQVAKKPDPHVEASKPAETIKNAAQIELLETKYRFEANGDSRKEVHTRVRINNELGVRQFARLNFDFNRSFQSVEIPQVRITHPSGGIADILPSAITDNPNPAVVDAPAYQDVRVKSVRILGLQPGDLFEYRVITTTTHHPLAPDFWLDHTFERTGLISNESFQMDLPTLANIHVRYNPQTPPDSAPSSASSTDGRLHYQWTRNHTSDADATSAPHKSDVTVATFTSWNQLAKRLAALLIPTDEDSRALREKAASLVAQDTDTDSKMSDIYEFVSQKIHTVDLPIGATGFTIRRPAETLASGYGSPEDKFALFAALGNNYFGPARLGLVSSTGQASESDLPSLTNFDHLLTTSGYPSLNFWMDLNLEVAPFRMIAETFNRKTAFVVGPAVEDRWQLVLSSFPFRAKQKVSVVGAIDGNGTLTAKVSYAIRGDNELILRLAFHQTKKDKWKDVAQVLAISDGFRGDVKNVTASDPYATKEPFSIDYEISQPKFVDWLKRPTRIPALLPAPGLPDATPGSWPDSISTSPEKSIDLGTPLEVELEATVQLPEGTAAQVPTGTSVERDYATFSSRYSAQANILHAARKLHFIAREIPATRAGDLNAFLHAVQADQTQLFTLQRPTPKKEPTPANH